MMRFFLPFLRGFLAVIVLMSIPIVLSAEPTTTFVLVDHSESMRTDQTEAQADLSYYLRNIASDDLVSVSYFGGKNGGDCRTDVAIETPVRKSELPQSVDLGPVDGDNPMLGAIESITKAHGKSDARIVIISDFDAACGATESACLAIRGFEDEHPNLKFDFEPIGDGRSTELHRCLKANKPISEVQSRYEWPAINFYSQTTNTSKLPPLHWGLLHLIYFLLVPVFWSVRKVWKEVSKTTDLLSKSERPDQALEKSSPESLGSISRQWGWVLVCILWIVPVVYWGCRSEGQWLSWWLDTINYFDTRLGAAVATVGIGSGLGFLVLAKWNNGLKQLENKFRDASELEASRHRTSYLSNFEKSYQDYINDLPDSYEGDDQTAFEKWKADIAAFYSDIHKQLSAKVQDETWDAEKARKLSFGAKRSSFRSRLRDLEITTNNPDLISEIAKGFTPPPDKSVTPLS